MSEQNTGPRSRHWQQDGVHSFLERVAIAEVREDASSVTGRCFTDRELAELTGKRAQTMAGFLALKKALVALFASLDAGATFSERDFVLAHDEDGAPRIISSPPPPKSEDQCAMKTPCISIAHTREWAYGLAVCQEAGRG